MSNRDRHIVHSAKMQILEVLNRHKNANSVELSNITGIELGHVSQACAELKQAGMVTQSAFGYSLAFDENKSLALTDHAAATVEALDRIVIQLKNGKAPEELGRDVELIGRMMARRT